MNHILKFRRHSLIVGALAAGLATYAGKQFWLAAGLLMAGALLEGAGLLLLVPIVGVLITGPLDNEIGVMLTALGATAPFDQLGYLLIAFVLAAVLRAQVNHQRDLLLSRIQLGYAWDKRVELISSLADSGWNRVNDLSHARVTAHITNDINRAVAAAQFLLRIIVALLILIVNSIVAVTLAPDLVLLLALLLALAGLFVGTRMADSFALGRSMRDSSQEAIGSTQNFLAGLRTSLAQEQQGWFVSEFARVQATVFDSQQRFQHRQSDARRLFAIASSLIAAFLVIGGVFLSVEPARLLVLVLVLGRLSGPTLQLQQNAQQLIFNVPSFVAVESFRRSLPPRSAKLADVPPPKGDIVLDAVTYRHEDGGGTGPVSLRIAPGEILGIEGPSGAGKSTLIDLLCGLIEPQSGRILVGGRPLDPPAYVAWRRTLSYLAQDTYLFNDTVRTNLGWSATPPADAELWQALAQAGAEDLVRGLALGLDTIVGEQGVLFSGGERQRIALARALLRRPHFLLLDEATNSIDIGSEATLFDKLESLANRPTMVVVAHRRETLARCTRVIALRDGRIVPNSDPHP